MKRWLISLSCAALLASAASAAFALPTVGDVQAEVQKGNYTQAQTMMREVVEAKPGSAKAHYIYAEILAHNARFVDAAEQARIAKQIDPAISFTTPDKFRAFQQLLDREQQAGRPNVASPSSVTTPSPRQSSPAPAAIPAQAPVERSSGIPVWVWVGAAAVLFFGWRMLSRRSAAPVAGAMGGAMGGPVAAYGGGAPAGYGPGQQGYAPGQNFGQAGGMMQPRAGTGMLGVGLAAAGGVAAGMLAEKYMGNHDNNASNPALDNTNLAGGNSFASPDRDQAAQELENRNVDFGSGSDWSDPGASDAGSFDGGSSGGGSDDW